MQTRPPTVEVVDVVPLAQAVHHSPVLLGRGKPLAVSGPNVDVHRAEVVVLLVARGAAAGHLHVQLHRVHAQDRVPHVAQHVARRHHASKGRQLGQLLQLGAPLALVGQVHVGAELDGLEVGAPLPALAS
ncbi:unnamed protein product, partial [Ixodes pacificus]